jgi:hypothetical protein
MRPRVGVENDGGSNRGFAIVTIAVKERIVLGWLSVCVSMIRAFDRPVDWHPASAPAASVEPATTNFEGFDESHRWPIRARAESRPTPYRHGGRAKLRLSPLLPQAQDNKGATPRGPPGDRVQLDDVGPLWARVESRPTLLRPNPRLSHLGHPILGSRSCNLDLELFALLFPDQLLA